MNRRNTPSAYTPSNTNRDLLNRIFVQRATLRERLADRLARSVTTGDKHHALLVGPRGCGKTNLVTLVIHDLETRNDLAGKMRIAWLGEDATFAAPIHLALGIADKLAELYPGEFPVEPRDAVRGMSPVDAAIAVLRNVVAQLENRTLVVVTENLDRTLAAFGDLGQKQVRAFLQETSCFATLATAQQLTDDLSSRDKPFFGFFDLQHLTPLSVDDARELIANISRENGDAKLVDYLGTAEGRYRVRALHHLAGGNHRMYVLLAEFLTMDALDDLVGAFEGTAEELTPYFQERLRSLPPQQAALVECLCNGGQAMSVKQIAESTFVEERTCAKQLGLLRKKGYVVSEKSGKESFYDMAEPLMRLCLEVKNERGRPLRTLARFLRVWFPQERLCAGSHEVGLQDRTRAYLHRAVEDDCSFERIIANDLGDELQVCLDERRYERAERLADELSVVKPLVAACAKAEAAFGRGAFVECVDELTKLIDSPNVPVEQVAMARCNRGVAYRHLGEIKKAIADYTAVTKIKDVSIEQCALALNNRGVAYRCLGEMEQAISDYTAVRKLKKVPVEQVAMALSNRGELHWCAGDHGHAQVSFKEAIGLDGLGLGPLTHVLFALPKAMVATCGRGEVIAALREAFEKGDPSVDSFGGTPRDLLGMVLRYGQAEWGRYITDLVSLYFEHEQASKLGQGLAQTIVQLDAGEYSNAQLDLWNQVWQDAGRDHEDLSIALASLNAATEAIKARSERPLFQLAPEIRSLVRPLLNHTLGEAE